MNAPCTAPRLAYNAPRGVRNHYSGSPHPIACGFFVPADHAMVGRGVNTQIAPAACSGSQLPTAHHWVTRQFENLQEAYHGR